MRVFFKFLSLFLVLTSCTSQRENSKDKYNYDDVLDKQISYLDVFNVESSRYYLYYYQLNCYYCHGIKSKVIKFSLDSKIPFYFVEIKEDYGFLSHSKEETIGTNDPMRAFSMMTPQLSLVEDGTISETYLGEEEIMNIIEYS